ncbi:MAG: sigma-70 family RNA polymerase sigma factor [Planctomycetota bacterium]
MTSAVTRTPPSSSSATPLGGGNPFDAVDAIEDGGLTAAEQEVALNAIRLLRSRRKGGEQRMDVPSAGREPDCTAPPGLPAPRAAEGSGGREHVPLTAGPGDSLTPAQLIDRHQRGVWRYLRMLGCDESTADDLTQETFLRVLRRENFVQHNDSATAGYLRRTAYNLLVSRHRKMGRVHTVSEPAMLDETWNRWAGKDLSGDAAVEALQTCLETLTERAQLALRMRFADQASRIEIGEALGITDHGARNLMQRAKAQLRECVEDKLKRLEH